MASLVDNHATLKTKTIVLRSSNPWYNKELFGAKHLKRKLECKWQKSNLTADHEIYRSQCAQVKRLLSQSRVNFYSEKIESYGQVQKT